ncbi:MAG: gluconate 2-dehydrogenase subunit 3 family protein, partial [Gemmatimonadales bacterium]
MERRDLLRALGAAAAVTILPRTAEAAWAAVVAAPHAPLRTLSAEQAALVGAIADTIIPRTDTPSASDVGIAAFVDIIVTEQLTDDERATFLAGLSSIDSSARQAGQGSPGFVGATTAVRESFVREFEARGDRRSDPGRAYWRLKSLVI